MPGRKENSRYKKKRKGFHSVQKQNMPVHHRQPTTSTSASNDSTTRSTSYNDQLEKKTSPDKLNCSLEKLERNCPLKTKEESKIFRRKRAFTELGLFDTSYPPKKQECYGSKIIDSSLLQTAINNSTICKHCKNPNSSLVLVQDDSKRHGLNETLNLQCSFCETSTIMNTNKEICRSSEINIRMAQCSLATGIGLTAMNKIQICSTLNLPHPGSKAMFNENMKKVSSSSVEEAEKSLQQSAKNVKTLLKQNCADFAEKDIDRAVGRSPKCIRKNPARWIQKNLRNINWYSCYELFKTRQYTKTVNAGMLVADIYCIDKSEEEDTVQHEWFLENDIMINENKDLRKEDIVPSRFLTNDIMINENEAPLRVDVISNICW